MMTEQSVKTQGRKTFLRRMLSLPIVRILVELTLFFGLLFALKSVLIKPGLGLLGFEERTFRAWQGVITITAMFSIYIGVMRFYERRAASELSAKYLIPDGVGGAIAGAGMVSAVFAALWLLGAFHILSAGSMEAMIVPVIWVVLLAAMEELMFRGILYRILEEWLGTVVALALSAGIFGLVHLFNEHADAISVLSATSGGLLMGALYSLTGRLWIPIFFHASWNFTQAIFGSTVSGTDLFGTYFESVREGPEWLTGGPFGVENSLLTIGLIVVVLAFLFRRMKRQNLFLPRGSARNAGG